MATSLSPLVIYILWRGAITLHRDIPIIIKLILHLYFNILVATCHLLHNLLNPTRAEL